MLSERPNMERVDYLAGHMPRPPGDVTAMLHGLEYFRTEKGVSHRWDNLLSVREALVSGPRRPL
jgi:hypothetical protein